MSFDLRSSNAVHTMSSPVDARPVERNPLQPSLVEAAWRQRWLVLGFIIIALIGVFAYDRTRSNEYVAVAELLVEEPSSQTGEVGTPQRPERYVLDQLEVLQSSIVAQRASELLSGGTPPVTLDASGVLEQLDVEGTATSNLVSIHFTAADEATAIAGADAVGRAYQETVKQRFRQSSEAALAQIDRSLEGLDDRLADVESQLNELRGGDERQALEEVVAAAEAELPTLYDQLRKSTNPDTQDLLRARITDIIRLIEASNQSLELASRNPAIVVLEEERRTLVDQKAALVRNANQIQVESELAPSGVALYFPPLEAGQAGRLGLLRATALGVVLGSVLGISVAYLLAGRRRTFTDRMEPELVLGTPLLADVPDFATEKIMSPVPVIDAPRSAAAEAYRFAAASLDIILDEKARRVIVVSPLNGAGKTTTVANLAIAAAREGSRVLVIDADFGVQRLSRLLTAELHDTVDSDVLPPGITEAVDAPELLGRALQKISLRNGVTVSLLSRGRHPVVAIDFFRSAKTRAFLERVSDQFDRVFIDCPPMLQVAYASTLAGYADAALVVIEHGSTVADLDELTGRLRFIGTSVVGYIYNRAPLRREMTVTEGSMRDIVGDQGWN